MTSTKSKLEFTHAMARHTRATVRQCEALMRYAATLQRLDIATDDAGLQKREMKTRRIKHHVSILLAGIAGVGTAEMCQPVFFNDPRGAVLKIRVPSGYTNDMGREGICVPS